MPSQYRRGRAARRAGAAAPERLGQPAADLVGVGVPRQRARERDRHAQRLVGRAGAQQPLERQADVAALLREPVEPLAPVRARRLLRGVLAIAPGSSCACRRSSGARSSRSAARSAANSRTVSSIPKRGCASRPESVRSSEVLSSSDDTSASRPPPRFAVADRLRCLQRGAALEDRQPAEQPPLGRLERLPGPLERRAQRALARRQVARAAGQQLEPVLEALQQRRQRQQPGAVGRQLDRQRQPVEARADRIDDRLLVVDRPVRPRPRPRAR